MISIIVPYYNAEIFLPVCVKCLSMQTEQNLEILMINDGSTDRGNEICEQAAATDSRFQCFTQKHAGVSSARNLGLEKANGEWIVFMDTDDLIHPETAKVIEEDNSREYDLLIYSSEQFSTSVVEKLGSIVQDKLTCSSCSVDISGENLLDQLCLKTNLKPLSSYCLAPPWSKAYRTEFIRKKHCQFPDIAIGEDLLFNIQVYGAQPRTKCIPCRLAYNFANSNSATRRYKPDMIHINERFHVLLEQELKKLGLKERYQSYIDFSTLNGLLSDFKFYLFHTQSKLPEWQRKMEFQALINSPEFLPLLENQKLYLYFPKKKQIVLWAARRHWYFAVKMAYTLQK